MRMPVPKIGVVPSGCGIDGNDFPVLIVIVRDKSVIFVDRARTRTRDISDYYIVTRRCPIAQQGPTSFFWSGRVCEPDHSVKQLLR